MFTHCEWTFKEWDGFGTDSTHCIETSRMKAEDLRYFVDSSISIFIMIISKNCMKFLNELSSMKSPPLKRIESP